MDKFAFVYHFTDIFLSEAVKETILIENWEEDDFDPRYEEYAKYFLAMKKIFASGKYSGAEIINELKEKRNGVVKNFNETMAAHFKNEIIKRGSSEGIANQVIPKNLFYAETVNIHSLKTFRDLEEKIKWEGD